MSKTPDMFRPPFVAIIREVLYEVYVTKTPQPMYRYKILFYIYGLEYVKLLNTCKITCAKFT